MNKLVAQLKQRGASAKDSKAVVSYEAPYALAVHENLEAHHEHGQAKFLEQPARQLQPELRGIITKALRDGLTLERALLLAAFRLQRESMLLVPVDTGFLKGSSTATVEPGIVEAKGGAT